MSHRPAIRTSRLAILDYYLTEAAKPHAEWHESKTGTLKSPDLKGHSSEDFIYETRRETYPSLVQKIARKLDRKKPQCFACHAPFEDWRKGLERAHIVASGEDTPSNFVLLCHDCHRNAPMTNNVDWMLEWVDRGPAAAGWEGADALAAATNAEMLAALNYIRYGAEPYTSVEQAVGFTLKGADTSPENLQRTWHEVAEEFEADFHFGSSSFSPATRALIALEAWGRVALKFERQDGTQQRTNDNP